EPAAAGTTSLTVREGKSEGAASWARVGASATTAATSAIIAMRDNAFMRPPPSKSLTDVVGGRGLAPWCRNIALRDVAVDGGALAPLRVAISAAPGRLHQDTFSRPHLVPTRYRRFEFVRCAEP